MRRALLGLNMLALGSLVAPALLIFFAMDQHGPLRSGGVVAIVLGGLSLWAAMDRAQAGGHALRTVGLALLGLMLIAGAMILAAVG